MKISTKGRYGTRALLDIALNQNGQPVQLKVIAERQQIPLHYLEQIVAPLVRAGLLNSTRGPSGGITLNKSLQDIKINEVLQILEHSTSPAECVDDLGTCPRADSCVMYDIWAEIKTAVDEVLESVTLQGLIERYHTKNQGLDNIHPEKTAEQRCYNESGPFGQSGETNNCR